MGAFNSLRLEQDNKFHQINQTLESIVDCMLLHWWVSFSQFFVCGRVAALVYQVFCFKQSIAIDIYNRL